MRALFACHAIAMMKRLAPRALLFAGMAAASPVWALDYLNVTVEPDRATPGACLSFSSELPRGKAEALEPFIAIEPRIDHALQARGKDLCISGLKFGQTYAITVKAGLPAADGTTLGKNVPVDLQVPDRDRQVSFDQGKTVLPFTKGVGLPLKSVNVAKAHVTLYHFSDRALVDQIANDWFGQAISGYNLDTVADRSSKVFDGSLAIASVQNKQITTTIPIDQLIKSLQPGIYLAIAVPDGAKPEQDVERATQWFSVSDIGLMTVKTNEGLLVSARSLQSAKPVANVDIRLIAQSNEILGTYKSDREGRFMIPGGLLRGEHGDAPKVLAAVGGNGDFTWLQLDAPALDLSDLDVKGRAPPETNDAFLWTDRGVYRPGETIHVGALLRDRNTRPVAGLPMMLHIVRPDNIEVSSRPIDLASASGGSFDFPVPDNAYSGTWRIWASAGDKKEVGTTSVSVQDFVPPRLEAKLTVPPGPLGADGAIEAYVAADYFYGSPGSDLTGQVEATLQPATQPFKGFEDFSFGLVQEPFLPKALTAQDFTTDDKGRATVVLQADETPDTTGPLEVALHATVNDVDGRPAQVDLTKTLHTADRFIGLDATFGEGLADGAEATFDVVMLDGDGKPIGAQSVKWDLVKEDYEYSYFYRDGRWQSKETIIDARVNGGDLVLGADGRGKLAARVTNGRWRIEAYDASGKTATSLRFGAGWWASTQTAENRKPEVMAVTIDANAPAGKVRAMVEPSFAGRVLVMLDGNGLHGIQEKEMPKGGGAVEFDAADVPASGAYVLAMAVSPAGTVLPRLPVRAVGLAWVPGATAAHKLEVTLKAPDTVHPKAKFDVDVSVAGAAPGEEAFVTLAAVDEAVLRMTDFATPDPADFYLGRREPSFELRDVYGSLIDASGQPGQLTQGGDGNANLKAGGLDVKTFKTVALFQGPVKLDAQGHATLSVDVPEFSGRLRLMTVAWTAERFGKADRPVTVRPPLLAELTLPRFLAPGDKADTRVMLTDLEAPEQTYTVVLKTEGAVSFDKADALFKDVKRDKRRYVDRVMTASVVPGVGRIHMTATGEDGTVAERDFEISVRTPNAYATNRQVITLAPGQRLVADDALGQGLVPGTGTLAITAATTPAFDVPGLLTALREYPYGCAEQTISRAFPELFVKKLGGKLALANAPTAQGAIQRLFSLQSSDGSFGYWSAFDTGNLWLTAYAVDFLQHARTQGLEVPSSMETRAVDWLVSAFATANASPADYSGTAYAAIVLARAKKLDLSQLRYVASRMNGHLPSDIARVQLAAALTHVGERDMASGLIVGPSIKRDPHIFLNDYGSDLRDRAMALSLAAEEKLLPEKTLFKQGTDLARSTSGRGWLSTQEEVWLLRSAFDLQSDAPLRVDLDVENGPGPVTKISGSKDAERSITATMPLGKGRKSNLVNKGEAAIFVSLASTGIPSGAQPAEATGFTITRTYLHLDGTPADLADVHQNDEMVILVEGTMADTVERKVLAVDMLPAGLEPETIGLSGDRDTGQFAWLKEVTDPTFTALRDDRYLAGLNLVGEKAKFKFAYVVRAVTPGTYARPGPQIEDMYAPAYHARGEAGTLEVKQPRKKVADKTSPLDPKAKPLDKAKGPGPVKAPDPTKPAKTPAKP